MSSGSPMAELFESPRLERFRELRAIVGSAESVRSKIQACDAERKRLKAIEDSIYAAKSVLAGLVENAEWSIKINRADEDDRAIVRLSR